MIVRIWLYHEIRPSPGYHMKVPDTDLGTNPGTVTVIRKDVPIAAFVGFHAINLRRDCSKQFFEQTPPSGLYVASSASMRAGAILPYRENSATFSTSALLVSWVFAL